VDARPAETARPEARSEQCSWRRTRSVWRGNRRFGSPHSADAGLGDVFSASLNLDEVIEVILAAFSLWAACATAAIATVAGFSVAV
jgi:hypothetical protein